MNKPLINVTPLIDVLLVLLIIFMIVTPLKPSRFAVKIPAEPEEMTGARPNIYSLIVAMEADSSLRLNNEKDFGTVADSAKLTETLKKIFAERRENAVYSVESALKTELSEDEKIEKTVFVKAPRSADYGSVARVIDAVKTAGASPISLQIDDLP